MTIARRLVLLFAAMFILVIAALAYASRTTADTLESEMLEEEPSIAQSLMRSGSPTQGYKRSNGIRRSRIVGSAAALRRANVL